MLLLQHLVWILGLKPAVGGALKPGRAVEGPSTVSVLLRQFAEFHRLWLNGLLTVNFTCTGADHCSDDGPACDR